MSRKARLDPMERHRYRLIKARTLHAISDYLQDTSYKTTLRILRGSDKRPEDVEQVRQACDEVMRITSDWTMAEFIEKRRGFDRWAACISQEKIAEELGCNRHAIGEWDMTIGEISGY